METEKGHEHQWGEWSKELWYTPGGRLQAEFRMCRYCPAVEMRQVERDQRPAVLQPTIGVFGGLFDPQGRILAKKIESGRFAGEIDAPGGGVDAERASQLPDERMFFSELARHVSDEVGILLVPTIAWKLLAPAVLKGGGDWAFPVVIGVCQAPPTKGETRFLSPGDLEVLARQPESRRILSGWGKRMHRIFLRLLCESPNAEYSSQAKDMLWVVHQTLGVS